MFLYSLARKANAKLKIYKKKQAGKYLSPVRRIEFVAPPSKGKFVAMTFDDGPCALPPEPLSPQQKTPESGLTETLLDILKKYDATVSFDVIGDTGGNYPDEPGQPGNFTWSGVHYDHYPRYEKDALAGAVNQPHLIRRILAEGHELTNHGYTHRLFGPMRAVYGKRVCFDALDEVTDDLQKLDGYIGAEFRYKMKLARPAHYIDKIPQGGTAYDAYRILGYQYMAASFDGGGWLPSEQGYEEDVRRMVEPMRRALEADPDCFNGKIIFQKDGCSMALQTPIVDALPQQLELLKKAGYTVVPVSCLLELSPFEDLSDDAPEFQAVQELLEIGRTVGYRNNTYQGERCITADEVALTLCLPDVLKEERPMGYGDLVKLSWEHCLYPQLKGMSGKKLGDALGALARQAGVPDEKLTGCAPKRKDTMALLLALCKKEYDNFG